MFEEQLKQFNKLIEELPDRDCSFRDAEYYSIQFTKAYFTLCNIVKVVQNELVGLKSLRNIAESNAFKRSPASSATSKKVDIPLDQEYAKAERDYQQKKNEVEYFKSLQELFMNAHIYYRGKARDK